MMDWSALGWPTSGALWCNPPYSKPNQPSFMLRARDTAEFARRSVCMLVQAAVDTEWFQDLVFGGGDLVEKVTIHHGPLAGVLFKFEATGGLFIYLHILRGRVAFVNPLTGKTNGCTGRTGSAVVAFVPKR